MIEYDKDTDTLHISVKDYYTEEESSPGNIVKTDNEGNVDYIVVIGFKERYMNDAVFESRLKRFL